MTRVPVIPTIIVALAALSMVGLGIWQLQRRAEKAVQLARYAQNLNLPPVAFPSIPVDDRLLFRRSAAFCLEPTSITSEGGRNARGGVGWRQIARCRTGVEGPGLTVQIGISQSPDSRPSWRGGEVTGYITHAPDHAPIIAALFGSRQPKTLMLVADPPVAGLDRNPPADISSVPNNHLAYAGQWFVFAAIAVGIYALALRRRLRGG